MALTRIDKTSAYERARDQLIALVRSGEYQVGDRLPTEAELALALGVSRSVVREALGSLKALALVRTETGRGTFVISKTPSLSIQTDSVEELHQVCRFLEIPAAGVAARHRSDASLQELERLLDALEDCEDDSDWSQLDTAFHVGIARASGNRIVADLVQHTRETMHEQLLALLKTPPTRLKQSNVEHRLIFSSIAAGNEANATKAMERHLSVYREILASMHSIDASSALARGQDSTLAGGTRRSVALGQDRPEESGLTRQAPSLIT